MPFVPPALIGRAVEALKGKHPLAVLVLPAMVKAGVPVAERALDGREYGSANETAVLQEYFLVPGGPPHKPFRAVWEADPSSYWRDTQYAGRSLQRIRTDLVKANRAFLQAKKTPPPDLWALRRSVGAELLASVAPVRIVDLAIWYGRARDVQDLAQLVEWFLGEFPLNVADLIPNIYTQDVPAGYGEDANPFAATPATHEEYAESLGAAPIPPPFEGTIAELAEQLEACVTAKGFISSPGFVRRVLHAWMRGDMVILVGHGGTGKTYFANLVAECLTDVLSGVKVTKLAVRADFDESDLIGYERLDGTAPIRPFKTNVLESDDPLAAHLVLLDEFNLASVETYLASVLVALEDVERLVTLPGGHEAFLPVDTFILAMCNSYLDEPETRLRVSFPTKRRAAVIAMPNVLLERFNASGPIAFVDHAVRMIRAEAREIQSRITEGRATATDRARVAALTSVVDASSLSVLVRTTLQDICTSIVQTPEGSQWLTMGVLRDIGLTIAMANRAEDAEMMALTEAVADKIVPQLRGPKERADQLAAVIAPLPNKGIVEELLDRMKTGPVDELLQLV